MNVQDLADQLADTHGMGKADLRELMTAIAEAIAENARSGEEFSWPGFGKFKIRERAARKARNPATGEMIDVAASRKLVFQPAKQLKDGLNAGSGKGSAKSASKSSGKASPAKAASSKGGASKSASSKSASSKSASSKSAPSRGAASKGGASKSA